MKAWLAVVVLFVAVQGFSQTQKQVTLRSILLEQLKTTHDVKDWFVPISVATEGLTAEQANWKDGKGNHSVGQLAYHLLFWNKRQLVKFKGEKLDNFSGNNEETFDNFDDKKWNDTVAQLNQVMLDLEKFVETADENTLATHASDIAHVGTHNAYHVGQMIFVRKLQGVWNPEKGVK